MGMSTRRLLLSCLLVLTAASALPKENGRHELISPNSRPIGTPNTLLGNQTPSHGRVPFEIRYVAPRAEQVYLLWGMNGWQSPDKSYWPAGAAPARGLPYCKMTRAGDEFHIVLSVPEGVRLDYCFNVLVPSRKVNIWDVNGGGVKDYHSVVQRNGLAWIVGQGVKLAGSQKPSSDGSLIALPWVWILPVGVLVLTAAVGFFLRPKRGYSYLS